MSIGRKIKSIKWSDFINEQTKTKIIYKSSGTYNKGEIINHSMFGLGLVIVSLSNRIEVLFEDKPRVLIQNFMF